MMQFCRSLINLKSAHRSSNTDNRLWGRALHLARHYMSRMDAFSKTFLGRFIWMLTVHYQCRAQKFSDQVAFILYMYIAAEVSYNLPWYLANDFLAGFNWQSYGSFQNHQSRSLLVETRRLLPHCVLPKPAKGLRQHACRLSVTNSEDRKKK